MNPSEQPSTCPQCEELKVLLSDQKHYTQQFLAQVKKEQSKIESLQSTLSLRDRELAEATEREGVLREIIEDVINHESGNRYSYKEITELLTDAISTPVTVPAAAGGEAGGIKEMLRGFIVQLRAGEVHCRDSKDSVGIATGSALGTIANQLENIIAADEAPTAGGEKMGKEGA